MSQKSQILTILENADSLISTNVIADQLGVHWKTVSNDPEDLQDQRRGDLKELNNRLTFWWDREIQL